MSARLSSNEKQRDADELWLYAIWIAVGLSIVSVLCAFTTVCSFIFKIVGG